MPRYSFALLLTAIGVIAVAFAAVYIWDVNAIWLLRDPNAYAKAHPLTGILSTLTTWVWISTSAICLFASGLAQSPSALRFAGFLSLYLGMDDALQIHEDLAQRYFGIPEKAVLALLAMAFLVYLWRNRRTLFQSTHRACLLAAMGCLGASVLIDLLERRFWPLGPDLHMLLEDSFKWLGASLWLIFHSALGHTALTQVKGTDRPPTA